MNKAIECARDILKLKSIANSTKSQKLKSDYTKSCKRKEKELMVYCKANKLLLSEVYRKAQQVI